MALGFACTAATGVFSEGRCQGAPAPARDDSLGKQLLPIPKARLRVAVTSCSALYVGAPMHGMSGFRFVVCSVVATLLSGGHRSLAKWQDCPTNRDGAVIDVRWAGALTNVMMK